MKLEEFARTKILQRAASQGKTIAGMEDPGDSTGLAVLDAIQAGELTHQGRDLKPQVSLQKEGEWVVEVMNVPQAEVLQGTITLSALDKIKHADAGNLIAHGMQNMIHKFEKYEAGRLTPEKMTNEELKALVQVDFDKMPIEDYIWGDDFIMVSQEVLSKQEAKETDGEHLEDSKLPATLAGNTSGELKGRHVLVIRAAPAILEKNPALDPTPTVAVLPSAKTETSNQKDEAPKETLGGDKGRFIPKAAEFTWAPDANQQIITASPDIIEGNPALDSTPTKSNPSFGSFLNGGPAPAGSIQIVGVADSDND